MANGGADERLGDAFAGLIRREGMSGKALDVFKLAGELAGLGNTIKLMGFVGGWWLDDRKADRVFPVLVALKDKLHKAEAKQNEYVRKEEFRDFFEDALRRIAEEPDQERREWLKNILLKVIGQPKEHTENRQFLRLVEELSASAHKVLTVLQIPTSPPESIRLMAIIAERSGVSNEELPEVFDELARGGLIDANHRGQLPRNSNGYLLTRLGRDFINYRGGTAADP